MIEDSAVIKVLLYLVAGLLGQWLLKKVDKVHSPFAFVLGHIILIVAIVKLISDWPIDWNTPPSSRKSDLPLAQPSNLTRRFSSPEPSFDVPEDLVQEESTQDQEINSKPQAKRLTKMPDYLEREIFEQLDGKYGLSPERVKQTLTWNSEENKTYLGTYFPRTYIETYNIFSRLFRNQAVAESFRQKDTIRILDVGAGQGAAALAIMDALHSNGLRNDKRIIVNAVDGNSTFLDCNRHLFSVFKEHEKGTRTELYTTPIKFSKNAKDFSRELNDLLEDLGGNFDIVITSKFLCEFYLAMDNSSASGIYKSFAKTASSFIAGSGFIVINDITTKLAHGNWFPIIIRDELCSVIGSREKGHHEMYYILPISCAYWHDNCRSHGECFTQEIHEISHCLKSKDSSKITTCVLAPRKFQQRILSTLEQKNKYYCNAQRPYSACSSGKLENYNTKENIDGFMLE